MLRASFHKGRTTRKKIFHFFRKRQSKAPTQMGENQAEEKEEKKEEGKVAGGAGEEKEGGGGDGKKEEAKNEGGGEGKKEGEGGEQKNGDEKEKELNPEIVLKVDMHCEGCARKVLRSLRGFPGVEEVHTDSKAHKVVVKGKKADPLKVCERIQKKSGKKTQLISPLPKPPEEKKEEKEPPKQEEKKEEPVPTVVTVILTVPMHCESCAQVVQRRIHKMKGVESVETDLKNDKVIVKGVVDPKKLVEYVYKQTRKQATIVPPPPQPPPPEEKQEEAKEEEKKEEKGESEKKEDEGGKDCGEEEKKSEVKKSEYWAGPRYYYNEYAYPPQIFSDENPNACTIM